MNCLWAGIGPEVGFVLFVAQYSAFEVFQLELFRPGRVLQGIPVPSTACCLNSLWLHISMAPPLSLQSWICFFLAVCSSRGALLIVLYGEGSLLCWSQLKTLSFRWRSWKFLSCTIQHPNRPQWHSHFRFGVRQSFTVQGSFAGKGRERNLSSLFFVCLFFNPGNKSGF